MWTEPLYTAEEQRRAEAGHDVGALMERAGAAVAEFVLAEFPDARRIAAVCGGGNNGGDGRIAARLLGEAGREVLLVDAAAGDEEMELGRPDVIVDALFGTGFRGQSRAAAAALVERINDCGADVVAVDVPSGVDASTGEVAGPAVVASATVTFHAAKVGSAVTPGAFHDGYLRVVDIGLDSLETEHARVTRDVLDLVPRRSSRDTKYTAGSVLVVGGSRGMTGAVALAARAAFRADAGYVSVAAPEESLPVLETILLEAVKRPLEEVFEAAERAGALALGPGLGRSEERRALVRRLLEETDLPAVVDADALDGLQPVDRSAATVLTPHSGELGRLIGVEAAWVDAHRLEAVRRAVERFGCTVLLKGAGTLVSAPGEGVLVCDGFPSLATAGTGDVLTGIVGAFLAKGLDPRVAAAAAATAHTLAAREAPQKAGLVAGDLLDALPRVLA